MGCGRGLCGEVRLLHPGRAAVAAVSGRGALWLVGRALRLSQQHRGLLTDIGDDCRCCVAGRGGTPSVTEWK